MRSGIVTGPQAFTLAVQGLLRALILICFSMLSMKIGGLYIGCAMLPLIAVYLWPFRAHYVWSMWAILFAGLIQDMISGGPLGMWVIVNCIIFLIVDPTSNQSKFGLKGHWGGFALVLLLAISLTCGLGRISLGQWPSFSGVVLQALISLALFPVVYSVDRLFGRLFFHSNRGES